MTNDQIVFMMNRWALLPPDQREAQKDQVMLNLSQSGIDSPEAYMDDKFWSAEAIDNRPYNPHNWTGTDWKSSLPPKEMEVSPAKQEKKSKGYISRRVSDSIAEYVAFNNHLRELNRRRLCCRLTKLGVKGSRELLELAADIHDEDRDRQARAYQKRHSWHLLEDSPPPRVVRNCVTLPFPISRGQSRKYSLDYYDDRME